MYGIELYGSCVLTGINRADCATTHTDPVVVSTEQDDLLVGLGCALLCITAAGIADTACEHDSLVIAIYLSFGLVL